MKPSIRFRCSGCNARINAPWHLLGQSRKCPGCGWTFVIQLQRPEDSDPLLVPGNWAMSCENRPNG